MIPLFQLILAHLLGDFLLQPTAWVMHKEKKKAKSPALYLHLLVHGVLILILLGFGFWILAIVLTILHGLVDLTKLYFQKSATKTAWFFIDQLAHFISILGIWWLFFRPEISLEWSPSIWIYATALLLITQVAGIAIQVGLSNWSKDLDLSQESSLKNAGKYIGILERLFVFAFVILGKWEAIGFLLAAKSVFRFGDLRKAKDRKLTEYILIGTLLSFGISIGIGILTRWLLTLL
jgi:magnesium-transporting ATPase (P-type)